MRLASRGKKDQGEYFVHYVALVWFARLSGKFEWGVCGNFGRVTQGQHQCRSIRSVTRGSDNRTNQRFFCSEGLCKPHCSHRWNVSEDASGETSRIHLMPSHRKRRKHIKGRTNRWCIRRDEGRNATFVDSVRRPYLREEPRLMDSVCEDAIL